VNRDTSRIESLLKLAGERDRPSSVGIGRARVAAHAAWRRALAARDPASVDAMPQRPWFSFAVIVLAGVGMLAGLGVWFAGSRLTAVTVARVSTLQGEVRIAGEELAGEELRSGDELETLEGRVALAIGDGLSLRVDRHTRMKFQDPGRVTLVAGAVYVDSGGLTASTPLSIDTPAGTVRHVGTQFQVQVRPGHTRVQVREGRVMIASADHESVDLAAGDLAEVRDGALRVEHGQPAFGGEWEWTASTAPAFDIENRPMSEFLAWISREHGWQLRYVSDTVQASAQGIRLHGKLEGLGTPDMIERVALITGVPLSLNDGVLTVGKR
jgi:hypothetical protein